MASLIQIGISPCSVTARGDLILFRDLNLSAPKILEAEKAPIQSKCLRVLGREVISKSNILNGKENIQQKKLDFFLHIYNIQIFNTLFQRRLQSMGLERW